MIELELSELNIVLSVVGAFLIVFGIISHKIKKSWYLGEALPAMLMGVILGPKAAKFIEPARWISAEPDELNELTLGVCRVAIGVQLVIVGFQLPAKYQLLRWKEKLIGTLPVMTIMWLATALCIFAIIPNLTMLSSLVIGACLACTDPILSQAIAKGAFAEEHIPRHLRDMMTSEAGANDSFSFPSLMLATFLIRHADKGTGEQDAEIERTDTIPEALKAWVLETLLYTILMGIVYGAVVGYASCMALKVAVRRRWIDIESLFLFPTAIGLFIIGTAGAIDTEELLACFAAGNALNWNGLYQEACKEEHDAVNPTIGFLLNLGAFLYIGSIIPWDMFSAPAVTYGRLFALGAAVLLVRRIPATMLSYKMLPNECANPREALVLGYMGPIGTVGIGAIYLAERTRKHFPNLGEGDVEESNLISALTPIVFFVVLFSIVIHGLSVPVIDFIYRRWVVSKYQKDDKNNILPFSETSTLNDDKGDVEKRESIAIFEEVDLKHYSWEAKTSPLPDHDKRSLDVSDVRYEVKEWV
ncbi:putative sodium hydrogen exchanger family protein [Diplodia seriata]|uniref:Putative sodium hydrogen exchanger family protein n=1 Tax=Diplodia seriata TaxID=420778 RepID=A0A0G2GAV2_9PEZI|nr:putative sodium hydrogen exchanger family protein [Diplodia seriata]